MAAGRRRFINAFPLILGWLSQTVLWTLTHTVTACSKVPRSFKLVCVGAKHSLQTESNCRSIEAQTMNFLSFTGSVVVVEVLHSLQNKTSSAFKTCFRSCVFSISSTLSLVVRSGAPEPGGQFPPQVLHHRGHAPTLKAVPTPPPPLTTRKAVEAGCTP